MTYSAYILQQYYRNQQTKSPSGIGACLSKLKNMLTSKQEKPVGTSKETSDELLVVAVANEELDEEVIRVTSTAEPK